MDVTVTCNLKPCTRQNLNAIERHVQHDADTNHSNKQIVFSDTELNKTFTLHDRDDVLNEHYNDYVNAKNEKLRNDFEQGKISLNRYEERKQTVSGIVGTNKAYSEILLTIGNNELQRDIYDRLGYAYRVDTVGEGSTAHNRYTLTNDAQRRAWSERISRVYANTAKDIDGKGFRVTQCTTNLDEGGADHCHVSAVNFGVTDKGKPSTSLNRAVISFLGATGHASEVSKNNIENFKILRAEMDSMLLNNFNAEFAELGSTKLIRKTATDDNVATDRDMRTYQHDMQTEHEEHETKEKTSNSNDINDVANDTLSHVHKHTNDVTTYDQQRLQRLSDDSQRRAQRLADQAARDAQLALQRKLREQEQDLKREKEKNERKKTELERREKLLDERELQSKHMYTLTTIKAALDSAPWSTKVREIIKSYVVRKLEEQQIQELRALQQQSQHQLATKRYEKEFDKLEL